MNPDPLQPDTSAAVSAYFDDALTPAGCRELADRLQHDAEAAREFARTARIHALLEANAGPQAAGRSSLKMRYLMGAVAAAALIAAGAVAWRLLHQPRLQPEIATHGGEVPAPDLIHRRKPLPPGVRLRTVLPAAAPAEVNLTDLCSTFYIPASPHGLTVPEALGQLQQVIAAANLLRRPALTSLRFTAGADKRPPHAPQIREEANRLHEELKLLVAKREAAERDRSQTSVEAQTLAVQIRDLEGRIDALRRRQEAIEPRINAPLSSPLTIEEYLRVCRLFGEIKITSQGAPWTHPRSGTIKFPPEVVPKSELKQQTFTLLPALLSQWLPRTSGPDAAYVQELPAPLFASPDSPAASPLDPSPLLMAQSAQWSRQNSTVTVTAGEDDLRIWEEVISLCANRVRVGHFVSTQFLLCRQEQLPPGFDPARGLMLSDKSFQRTLRELSLAGDVEISKPLTLVATPGTDTSIRNIQPVPLQGSEPRADWIGMDQAFVTGDVGETVQVSGLTDLGIPPVTTPDQLVGLLNSPDKHGSATGQPPTHYQTGYDLWIPGDCTALFTLDAKTGDGRVLIQCVTVKRVDPSGQLIR